jgi:Arc/MetJ family transcription regulator
MRTNIDIDDDLMAKAMAATGAATKKATVETALRLAVQMGQQETALQGLWGIGWEGDLNALRDNPHQDWDRDWREVEPEKHKSVA